MILTLSEEQYYNVTRCLGEPLFLNIPSAADLHRPHAKEIPCQNAFVSTAHSSHAFALRLTGRCAHVSDFIDDKAKIDKEMVSFPELLQAACWKTAFIGKRNINYEIEALESSLPGSRTERAGGKQLPLCLGQCQIPD